MPNSYGEKDRIRIWTFDFSDETFIHLLGQHQLSFTCLLSSKGPLCDQMRYLWATRSSRPWLVERSTPEPKLNPLIHQQLRSIFNFFCSLPFSGEKIPPGRRFDRTSSSTSSTSSKSSSSPSSSTSVNSWKQDDNGSSPVSRYLNKTNWKEHPICDKSEKRCDSSDRLQDGLLPPAEATHLEEFHSSKAECRKFLF